MREHCIVLFNIMITCECDVIGRGWMTYTVARLAMKWSAGYDMLSVRDTVLKAQFSAGVTLVWPKRASPPVPQAG